MLERRVRVAPGDQQDRFIGFWNQSYGLSLCEAEAIVCEKNFFAKSEKQMAGALSQSGICNVQHSFLVVEDPCDID